MGQDKVAKAIVMAIKGIAILGLTGTVGFLLYNVATAESAGRQRALAYEKEHGKKKQYVWGYLENPYCLMSCSQSTSKNKGENIKEF